MPKGAYADFLTAASRRYGSVDHWMIWGETNRSAVFRPLPPDGRYGPRRYARLLAAAYRALKRESPRNVVIGGMTFSFGTSSPVNPLASPSCQTAGRRRSTGVGTTRSRCAFPTSARRSASPAHGISAILICFTATYGAPIWASTGGFAAGRRGCGYRSSRFPPITRRGEFNFYTTRRGQAQWLTAAYRIARRTPWIAGLGWIGLLDDPVGDPLARTNGLVTHRGRKKPAYYAYKRAR